ncbi:MAG: hypothetical protein Q8Q09_16325 [Deltaproteobacteria bacterium]|nr:hypothetical protein [Deltaproteobacteria bacterium]
MKPFQWLMFAALASCAPPLVAPQQDGSVDASMPSDEGPEASLMPEVSVPVDAGFRCTRGARAPLGDPLLCNGSAQLCSLRFDQGIYPTTHNSFAIEDERFGAPNQRRSLRTQLDDGVRGLMLDVHYDRGRVYLCHGPCSLGRRLFSDALCELTRFLDERPDAVLTLILESYVSANDVVRSFEESSLIERVYAHPVGSPWPTLESLVRRDKRVIVLTDREGGAPDWYMPVWTHARETPYAARTPEELAPCTMNRGRAGNALLIFNHFLTNPLGSPELSAMVNHNPFLLDRARRCEQTFGQPLNFVTVDYYDVGDLFATTRALQGLTP